MRDADTARHGDATKAPAPAGPAVPASTKGMKGTEGSRIPTRTDVY